MEEKGKRILYRGGEGEITEKKSRFIAQAVPVKSEEEAMQYLTKVKKQYYDARHHCFAYVIDGDTPLCRSGDDGEPSGTAGKPILEVLLGEKLGNALIVVTRYFGGTLLGTGGLVRAYTQAAKESLLASEILEQKNGSVMDFQFDYNDWGKVQYLIETMGIFNLHIGYTEHIDVRLLLPEEKSKEFLKKVSEATSGRDRRSEEVKAVYVIRDGKAELMI